MNLRNLVLKHDTLIPFKAGETIYKEGDDGDSMFILIDGIVEVFIGDKLVGTFEPVEIFGEMAVIAPGPRSASVVAKTNCTLAVVNQKRFMLLIGSKPELAMHIMQMLVERIRWMNDTMRARCTPEGDVNPDPVQETHGLNAAAHVSDPLEHQTSELSYAADEAAWERDSVAA